MCRIQRYKLIPVFLFLTLFSCRLIDTSGLNIRTNPGHDNEILTGDLPISIEFSKEVRSQEAEQFISLSSENGSISVDFLWNEKLVQLSPLEDLQRGIIYYLEIDGKFITMDNQNFSLKKTIPFYFESDSPQTILTKFSPLVDQSIDVDQPLILEFSNEISKEQFQSGFSLNPSIEFDIEIEGTQIQILPKEQWENLERYSWEISDAVLDTGGVPLLRAYSGSFLVQLDHDAPYIESFFPCEHYTGGTSYMPTAAEFNQMACSDSFYFLWNEPMDFSSLEQGLSFNPELDGILYQFSPTEYIFTPQNILDFKTEYTLTLDTNIKDISGNTLKSPIETQVKLNSVSAVGVSSLTITDDAGTQNITDFNDDAVYTVTPYAAPRNALSFSIVFNQDYPLVEDKKNIEDSIRVAVVFPQTLVPYKTYFQWISDAEIYLTYEGFSTGTSYPLYHELRIIGGTETLNSQTGAYIPEDIYVRFNTQ